MNILPRLVVLFTLALASLRATTLPATPATIDPDSMLSAVRAADDARLAALKAGDRARLEGIFSDELRYAHSSGKVDGKASYLESLANRSSVYESFDYQNRTFLPAAPGIVLMSGRVLIHSRNGDQKLTLDLNFLAVWREERGHWRFLAWQSCRNMPATK